MAKIYIAGPMRNVAYFNFPEFDAAAARLRADRWTVVSPAELDRKAGFDPMRVGPDRFASAEACREFPHGFLLFRETVDRDLVALSGCDAIYLLDNWSQSKGARAEAAVAVWLGLDIRFASGEASKEDPFLDGHVYHPQTPPVETPPEGVGDQPAITEPLRPEVSPGSVIMTTSATGGEKGQKLARFDLIPADVEWLLAEHYGKNCKEHGGKYESRNWEKGYGWMLSIAACRRHLTAFLRGQNVDTDSGSLHLVAAAWHLFALIHFQINPGRYGRYDDRPKTESIPVI